MFDGGRRSAVEGSSLRLRNAMNHDGVDEILMEIIFSRWSRRRTKEVLNGWLLIVGGRLEDRPITGGLGGGMASSFSDCYVTACRYRPKGPPAAGNQQPSS